MGSYAVCYCWPISTDWKTAKQYDPHLEYYSMCSVVMGMILSNCHISHGTTWVLLEWATEMFIYVSSSWLLMEKRVVEGIFPHLALNLLILSSHSNFRRTDICKQVDSARLILAVSHNLYDQDLKHYLLAFFCRTSWVYEEKHVLTSFSSLFNLCLSKARDTMDYNIYI